MDSFKLTLITSLTGLCLPQLILLPQKAEILEGENVLLTCLGGINSQFFAIPWTWNSSNNQNITLYSYRHKNFGSDDCNNVNGLENTTLYSVNCYGTSTSILLRNITRNRHDERWECRQHSYKSNNASVYVIVPVTSVQIEPMENIISTTENSIINMSCETSFARPTPNVTWYHTEAIPGRESPVPLLDGIREQIQKSTDELFSTKSEISYQVNRSFNGRIIYCLANNYPGKTAGSAKKLFDVKYMASVISFLVNGFEGKDMITVVENDTVQFTCLIDTIASNAKLKFSWKTLLVEEFDTTNLTYTLNRVSCRDTGEYTCIARNALNYGEPSIRRQTLLVKCPPHVDPNTPMEESVQAKPGDTITFSLNIIAYPEPQLSDIVWMKLTQFNANWTIINSNLHTETSVKGLQTNLTIKNVTEEDYGIYRLTVTNELGSYLQNFNLTNAVKVGTEEQLDNNTNSIVIGSIAGIAVLTGIICVSIFLTRKRKCPCMNGKEGKKIEGNTSSSAAAETKIKPSCSEPQNMYEEIQRNEELEKEYQEIQLGEDDMCVYKNI